MNTPNIRVCPTCQKSPPEASFFKHAERCRSCLGSEGRANPEKLAVSVEKHRQNKILREELRKIARQRIDARRRTRAQAEKRKAVEKLIPKAVEPEKKLEVDAVTREIATRILLRRRLIEFVKEFHPKYLPGWVHHDICRRLEQFSQDVTAGKSPRLMILMPPRHGKSQIASKLFPAWHLGHNPDHEIIACSYNVSLANDFSSEVREVVRSERYAGLFPKTRINPEKQGVEAWKLLPTEGIISGGYVAAGIGGPINGKGAHVLIIDDPIKNEEEAGSIDHLRKISRWFDSTAYTRLAPGGGVLIIQTWWSDMDLAGQLQDEMKEDPEADKYVVVKYPAVATEDEEFRVKGEPLHPERWPLEHLDRIKRKLGGDKGRFWNALYQQNPIPADGAFFTREDFVWRTEMPDMNTCHIYQAWDFAIGEKRTNDYTVGTTIAVDYDDREHVMEVVRFRSGDQLKIANEMLNAFERYPRVLVIGVEDGQIWRGIKTHLYKRMAERRLNPSVEELRALTDKMVRAQPLQGRMKQRKVTFPKSADWIGELLKEFLRFPAGMHDDIVDSLAWCMTVAIQRSSPKKPVNPVRKGEQTVAQKVRKFLTRGGGSAMAA